MTARDFNRGIRHGRRAARRGVDGQSARVAAFRQILHKAEFRVAILRRELEPLEEGRQERGAQAEAIEAAAATSNPFGVGPRLAPWVYGSFSLAPFIGEFVMMRQVTAATLGDSGFGTLAFPTIFGVILLVLVGDLAVSAFMKLKEAGFQGSWVPAALCALVLVTLIAGLGAIRSNYYTDPDQAGSQAGPVAVFLLASGGSAMTLGYLNHRLRAAMKVKGTWRRLRRADLRQATLEKLLARWESRKEALEVRVQNYRDGYMQGSDLASREPGRWWRR